MRGNLVIEWKNDKIPNDQIKGLDALIQKASSSETPADTALFIVFVSNPLFPSGPPCPPDIFFGRTNLRAARLLRFFYVQNSSAEKKISEGVGMDLNYRPPALQAGFAMFFADPAFFSCPDW